MHEEFIPPNSCGDSMTTRNAYIMVHDETKAKIRQVAENTLGAEASNVPLGTVVSMMADDYLGGSDDD